MMNNFLGDKKAMKLSQTPSLAMGFPSWTSNIKTSMMLTEPEKPQFERNIIKLCRSHGKYVIKTVVDRLQNRK